MSRLQINVNAFGNKIRVKTLAIQISLLQSCNQISTLLGPPLPHYFNSQSTNTKKDAHHLSHLLSSTISISPTILAHFVSPKNKLVLIWFNSSNELDYINLSDRLGSLLKKFKLAGGIGSLNMGCLK